MEQDYLILYSESIKTILELNQQNKISLTDPTKELLTKELNEKVKFKILIKFRKYNFKTTQIKTNPTAKELYNICLQFGNNKNLIWSVK